MCSWSEAAVRGGAASATAATGGLGAVGEPAPEPSPGPLKGTAVEEVERAVDRLVAERFAGVEREAGLRSLTRDINRMRYVTTVEMGDFATAEGGGPDEFLAWTSTELGMSRGAAAEQLLLARQIADHPRTGELLAAGELGYEQAAIVAHGIAGVAQADALEIETRLLAEARANPAELWRAVRRVVAEVDGERLRQDTRRAWDKRALRFGRDVGGSTPVSGFLTAELATRWRLEAEPYMCPVGPEDDRSKDQRLHDATLAVLRGGAVADGAPHPGETEQRARGLDLMVDEAPVTAVSDAAVLRRVGRRPQLVVTAPLSALLGEGGPPALLQGLVPISPEQLDKCLCEADLTLLLRDSRGNLVFQGRSARTFSPAKQRAIFSRYPLCVWPGCGIRGPEGVIHHLVEFNQNASSMADEGVPSCFVHHDKLHEEGWALIEQDDGSFRVLPPDHPDNPRTGLGPEEYLRLRRLAIFQRQAERRRRHRRKPG